MVDTSPSKFLFLKREVPRQHLMKWECTARKSIKTETASYTNRVIGSHIRISCLIFWAALIMSYTVHILHWNIGLKKRWRTLFSMLMKCYYILGTYTSNRAYRTDNNWWPLYKRNLWFASLRIIYQIIREVPKYCYPSNLRSIMEVNPGWKYIL